MTTVQLDGIPFHVESDGAGSPVLVLHGGLGIDHVLYRRTLRPLADDVRLVHYDQRGNGRSVPADLATLTMQRLADDAVALADHLGLDRFSVLGHSYGGFVAQELALRHPDRIAKLVLVDTTPGHLGTGEVEGEHGEGPVPPTDLLELFAGPDPESDEEFEQLFTRILPAYFHRPDRIDLAAIGAGCIYRVDAMVRGFEVVAGWSSVDRLAEVRAPTLVIAGRHDVVTAWPQAMRIGTRIPDAQVELFDESGHFPWLEEPDRFFPRVRDFLLS